jgi:hypothetical protein
MIIKQGFMLREVAGNFVVVAIGEASKKFNGVINLNESGAFLWKQLTKEVTKEQLLEALLNEYDVSEEIAKNDIDKFINKLKEADILE